MINGFEEYTYELTEYESTHLLPVVVLILKNRFGKENSITGTRAVKILKEKWGLKVDPARFRKVVSHIRVNDIINRLMATSKGYYISTDKNEFAKYIESLDQRINQIVRVRESMVRQHFKKQ